ncbi:MAG: hypothetical protein KBG28_15465 [Kofleriaceae bacterium]|nr:hypothetical protein [Kofleriaceae bacterium]
MAHLKRTNYNTLAGGDQSSYASGSGRVVTFTRGAGNTMTLGYDSIGRRTFEYDSFDAVRSRRDYTYLPNGQLGTVCLPTYTLENDPVCRAKTIAHEALHALIVEEDPVRRIVQPCFSECRVD